MELRASWRRRLRFSHLFMETTAPPGTPVLEFVKLHQAPNTPLAHYEPMPWRCWCCLPTQRKASRNTGRTDLLCPRTGNVLLPAQSQRLPSTGTWIPQIIVAQAQLRPRRRPVLDYFQRPDRAGVVPVLVILVMSPAGVFSDTSGHPTTCHPVAPFPSNATPLSMSTSRGPDPL
ncbi:hypothetical protein BC826DRAFT_727643 [Russula brevipes]|nr:hypothetical protein BC826DRAFT_727643 [Russula brevipes]